MTEPGARPRCTDRCNRMTDRGLCGWCRARVARELASLPELWTALGEALQPSSGHGDGRGASEQGIGVRVDVLSFLGPAGEVSAVVEASRGVELHPGDQEGAEPLAEVLASWAELVAQERQFAQRDRWTFANSRKYLVVHHDWICGQPWADDYAAELHQVWTVAMTLTDSWESATLMRGVYCPWCKAAALYQDPGGIECQARAGGCGTGWDDREHYEQTVKMRAAYELANGAA